MQPDRLEFLLQGGVFVTLWRILREWPFEGLRGAGANVEGGRAFALEHTQSREQRQLSVEVARGERGVAESRMREVAQNYLDDPRPPRRVIIDRSGSVLRLSSDEQPGTTDSESLEEPVAEFEPNPIESSDEPDVEWDG